MSKRDKPLVLETMLTPEYLESGNLEKMHTKQLLAIKSEVLTYCYGCEELPAGPLYKKVKSILDTREHIPNKAEAKKIRQEKAKQHR